MTAPAHAVSTPPVDAEVGGVPEQPRYAATLDLVALPTAITVTRLFVGYTLNEWHAMFVEPDMEAVAAELVALAVEATGPAEGTGWNDIEELRSIRLRLLGFRTYITIQVADEHDEPLVYPEDTELPDDYGLGLVDARAGNWGSFPTPRGRVMWANLPVYGQCHLAHFDHGVDQRFPGSGSVWRRDVDGWVTRG